MGPLAASDLAVIRGDLAERERDAVVGDGRSVHGVLRGSSCVVRVVVVAVATLVTAGTDVVTVAAISSPQVEAQKGPRFSNMGVTWYVQSVFEKMSLAFS